LNIRLPPSRHKWLLYLDNYILHEDTKAILLKQTGEHKLRKKFKVSRKLFCPDMKTSLPWCYMNSMKYLSYNIFFIWLSSLGKRTPLPEYKSIRFTMIFMHMNLQPKQENTFAWVQHDLHEIIILYDVLYEKYPHLYDNMVSHFQQRQ
jgi:hypothetical protein